MSGNFRAGPEKIHQARKPGIVFRNPEFLKHKTNFLTFLFLTSFDKYMRQRVQILPETGFYDAKHHSLRTIFTGALKNNFGKMVILLNFPLQSGNTGCFSADRKGAAT